VVGRHAVAQRVDLVERQVELRLRDVPHERRVGETLGQAAQAALALERLLAPAIDHALEAVGVLLGLLEVLTQLGRLALLTLGLLGRRRRRRRGRLDDLGGRALSRGQRVVLLGAQAIDLRRRLAELAQALARRHQLLALLLLLDAHALQLGRELAVALLDPRLLFLGGLLGGLGGAFGGLGLLHLLLLVLRGADLGALGGELALHVLDLLGHTTGVLLRLVALVTDLVHA